MKKLMIFVAVAVLAISAVAGTASAKTFLSIATGGTAGTYYPVGGGIADVVSRHAENLQVTAETGNASAANLNLIGTHQIEVALVQNDVAYWAWKGQNMFSNPFPNVRAIASLYPEHVHLITLKKTGIKDFMDIKGKRVSVGAPGSGVEADVRSIFEVAGLKYEDMSTDFLDFNNTTQRFKDGQLDAGFVVAGYPVASIMDLATMHDISLVNFDDEFLKKLEAQFPYFAADVIPAGTYKGVDQDVKTPAVMAMIVCDGDLPEETIYEFTKALWDNIDELYKVHSKAQLVTLDTALVGISVPVHPGAAKYYAEKGLNVPEVK
ncbi:MAG: TAXI family TRAP transporter solute-binding subunit [Synergistaceae bacterium]|nr:TAXI family TRAP transporter solute-binding subunit [Synergistaceae bacterium]